MDVTHDKENIRLTSGEISELFNTYISNSASICVLSYFAKKSQDPDICAAIEFALNISKKSVAQITNMFSSINHPLPKGFSDEDVNINARKLYTDTFMLHYIRLMARFGLTQCGESRASCARFDVRDFFDDTIQSMVKLFDMVDDILLSKGLYLRQPYIPIPRSITPVEQQGFLNSLLSEKRPLNASDINRLHLNFQRNSLGKAFLTGLCQTTTNKEVKDYLIRGRELSDKHMKVVSTYLEEDDLPVPMTLDSEVTDSTEPVFSDKLAMFHIVALGAIGLAVNGISFSRVMRRDLALSIARLTSEVALYAEDGMNIMIKNKWLEKMPEAVAREELIGV